MNGGILELAFLQILYDIIISNFVINDMDSIKTSRLRTSIESVTSLKE
jgi:hypothetical protein